jgi:teichuronic acid biosynthesis glycosyltransferase TuaC
VCCITGLYPSVSRPYHGTFVKEFVWALARQGARCTVVSPETLFSRRYGRLAPRAAIEHVDGEHAIRVLRPRYVSASSRQLLGLNTGAVSEYMFERVVRRTFRRLSKETDIVYGHFLYPSGRTAVRLGLAYGLPSIVRHGEGCLEDRYQKRGVRDFSEVTGVISNTHRLKQFCEQTLGIPGEKVRVFLNAVDRSIFRPRDRSEMRRRLGLPQDKFLVIFVGYFTELKGPHRVLQAIAELEGVSAILVGAPQAPDRIELTGPKIAFIGPVEHTKLPEYLCAADVFVLPTTMEGCCNAILEAMACGIPVVSSKRDFNDEIIDDDVAIRVDPDDVEQIRQAIGDLRHNRGLRESMARACLVRSRRFDIDARASEAIAWFGEIITRTYAPGARGGH